MIRSRVRARPSFLSVLALVATLLPIGVSAQNPDGDGVFDADAVLSQEGYVAPPDAIRSAVLAPRYLNLTMSNVSPDKRWFLNEIGDGPVTMDVFSKPFHELGGQFIDYAANRNRRLTIRNSVRILLTSAEDGSATEVEVPRGARVSDAAWAPDGSRLAFFAHFDDATHIYTADPETGRSRQVTRSPVLATLVMDFDWSADGSRIATVLVPGNRPRMPVESAVPVGPQIKRTEDGENRLRTYASLMATPYDKELLRWHATGQVAVIDVERRRATNLGDPTLVRAVDLSPDGQHVMVTRMEDSFSYIVPVNNFGTITEVWDMSGTLLGTIDADPLDTGIQDPGQPQAGPFGPEPTGKRELAWRVDGAGLTFLEQEAASDDDEADAGGDQDEDVTGERRERRKDRVMQWSAPFDSAALTVVYESDSRIATHRFSPDHQVLFLSARTGQNVHEYAVYLSDPETEHTLARYDADDFYANRGSLVMTSGLVAAGRGGFFRRRGGPPGNGATVQLSSDGAHVFFVGIEYAENPMEVGPKGFIDRVSIEDGAKERIYEGDNSELFERVTAVLDVEQGRLAVSRETPTETAQAFLRQRESLTQLTQNQDYTPDLTGAPTERFVVERPDGFRFMVNVTLPPDYEAGTRLPAMFWFYPREYEDQDSYDEGVRMFNKNAFPSFGTRSMEYLVRLGYAVVEPDAPIVGPQGRMNNNYEHDLRNNLAAVIDELDQRGIIDRQRLGIGGHSYGAFSTANAMVHTPFFKAGIAGDGNYNRTFTPLSFQSERRFLWDAKDVYLGMSPFLYANNLTGALLLYHGQHDQNVGTDPDHSPRLFHALNGLGKTSAMYLYPFEDHGPATEETLLDLWARWTAWLDLYLKNPEQANARTVSDGRPQ